MSYYITTFIGDGTKANPIRALGQDGNPDRPAISLAPSNYALLYIPTGDPPPNGVTKISDDKSETLSNPAKNYIQNQLGYTEVDLSGMSIQSVIATLLMQPPASGWKPITPVGKRFGAQFYEVWLGGLLFKVPVIQGGASDNFNRSNESPLAAPWVLQGYDAMDLDSNHVLSTGANDNYEYYSGAASGNDQYSQLIEVAVSSHDFGASCRIQSGAITAYNLDPYNGAQYDLMWHDAGTYNHITNIAFPGGPGSYNVGDIVRLEAEGSTLRAYLNGTLCGSPVTDGNIPSGGQPGFFIYSDAGTIDDWEGGDLGGDQSITLGTIASGTVVNGIVIPPDLYVPATEEGQTLEINPGTYTPSAYYWQRADDGSGTNAVIIPGENGQTYTVQAADVGKYIRGGIIPS